ncbi:MAG: HAMP domain-containing histidine kinase [Bacteroidetes bacterium]|nr:MAG: HAMP domain-containing histidine kinase [Bacteroidota bacterium]
MRPRSSEDRQSATDTTTDTIQESADADTTGEPSLESGERVPIDIRGAADHQNRNEYDLSLAEGGGLHNSIKSHPVLSRYSKRLEALNELSVSTLKGINQEIIVSMALTHLAELITFDFARVIEYDVWKGEGRPLGIHTDSDLKILDYTHKPITYFRGDENVDRFQRYVSDLESLPNPSELDRDLLSAGLRSYFRQALQLGNEVIGTLTVASRQKDAFTLEEMKIARDIVDLISLAVSQSRNNSERDRYEAELISAKNRAEEMARVKTAFLSNMSHEVRTPLSGIIGFAQIMRSELEGEMGEFASLIYDGGTRLLETINSVLDFAKLEAGQLSMVATPTDVNETIRETIKLLTGLAEKKNLPITQDLLDGPLYCTLDRSSLERILNNLIGNAIKFTEEGYIEVSTELTGEFGRIVISDTGPGISEEFMPDLFNEFYQEEMGNDRKHGGSGLGLAITRRLVDKMGGWIEVDNREIRGTTFAITFPITSMEESGINNGKVNSVLVVSGSDTINHLDYAALQHDMDVQTVPDLKVAVQHARHRRFDMVVVKMDHQDTEIEMERVRAVREIPEYDKVPFIALSDEPFSEMEQRMLAREFDGFSQSAEGLAGYLFRLQERNQQISESEAEAASASDAGAKQQSDDVQDHFPLWEDES